jgi:regulatory protein
MRRPGRKAPLSELEAQDPNHAQAQAVALLAQRDYSRHELRQKLAQRGYGPEAIEPVIIDLEQTRKLDDQRYGANRVAYRARRGQGPARIRNELRRAGMAPEAVESALKPEEDAPDFVALARRTRSRKFGPEIPKDWKERARQARFLQYRGFSTDHIRAALEGDPLDGPSE